ncbi:MAG: glycosyltransferase [Chlorobi bacterium]|nr:glycosyltransferase [Chlorobiota bacterium]MCI0715508.1 glycosyltransferase [Chlorobiota bacterium]
MINANEHSKPFGISFISSYVPRHCGIAKFTSDLANSIIKQLPGNIYSVDITALNDIPEGYRYSSEVKFEIKAQSINDYKEAAYFLNLSDSDVVSIQHEFGLYGGDYGSNILYLLEKLNKPIVTTLHTIVENPSDDELKILKEIGERSSFLVVLSRKSIKMLKDVYDIGEEKINFIPHGAPDVPFLDTVYYKDKFKISDKRVILTFGLLSPGKGVEDVINSLPGVIEKYIDVIYIVLGATHPNIKRKFGESYRDSLENLVKKLGLENHVMFINRFVDDKELLEFLLMSDIYVSPYNHKEQVVSGTLTYALACGKAVVSTPYWYAEEILNDGKGMLVPFKNPDYLKDVFVDLLIDENIRNKLRKNAYDAGREMIWKNVGKSYASVFHKAAEEFKSGKILPVQHSKFKLLPYLPEVNLNHVKNLTDSTGILQHATFSIPNPNEGYCTDDNVRALLISMIYEQIYSESGIKDYINKYLMFVHYSFNEQKGLFRNFMSYDRRWLEETGSEDCNGRVIFVLGYMVKNASSSSILGLTKSLFDKSIKNMTQFKSLRAIAYIIMGCILYLERFSGARDIKKICRTFAENLFEHYDKSKDKDWLWFENKLTYINGRLPQALLMAGRLFGNDAYLKAGLESLSWLYNELYDREKNCLSIVGNNGWYEKGKQKAKYDQQPIEIPPLIDAFYQAYYITRDYEWVKRLGLAFSWFLGNNERQEILYNYETGGCYDGLTSTMINQNQGAESTISWLLSLLRMSRISQELQIE